MENKITLYTSDGVKIGETFTRRASQLVKQQRAMWTDDSQTAIRFAPGMENMSAAGTFAKDGGPELYQVCFACWTDGHYYPGVVTEVLPGHAKIAFLDNDTGFVPNEHIVGLDEAFETMEFQGKWQNGLFYYKGVLSSHRPLIMHYNDGAIEKIDLKQLRGVTASKPKNIFWSI